jgi:Cu/Ag efflux pump CusA
MRNFNLAEWAINHRPFVTFILIVLLVGGAWSYARLGRSEDPPFTVKVMIVQAQWPGATIADTVQQVTEKIEKKLQARPRQHSQLHVAEGNHPGFSERLGFSKSGSEHLVPGAQEG